MKQDKLPPLEDMHISLKAYLGRAWTFLNELTVTPDTHQYLYAALDLRFFIERFLTLVLHITSEGELSKKNAKLYRPKDFERVVSLEKLDCIIKNLDDTGINFPGVDIAEMSEIYGRLGNYLHAPTTVFSVIEDEQWKLSLESVVLAAYEYLEPYGVYEHFEKDRYLRTSSSWSSLLRPPLSSKGCSPDRAGDSP